MWLGISCFAFQGELQASYSCSLETVWPWDGGLSRVSGSPDIKASEKQTLKRHDGPTFPQPLPRLPPDRRQALDFPNSPPHNNQQSKNKITRNTTPIWPLHTRTCAHGLACSKPACTGKLRPLWPFLLRPHLGHAPRPPLPARPHLPAWATCPAPQPAHTCSAFQSAWEGAPLSGHRPQPVWVLDPGASPPGLHAHQGDPGNRTRRGSWQMLTVGF